MPGLKRLIHEIHRRSLWQVLLIYLGASYAILEAVDLFIARLGLPDWVFQTALVLLLIGLPIITITASIQAGGKAQTRADPTLVTAGARGDDQTARLHHSGLRRLFTWRNALLGGVLAFTLLGIGTAGYMAMRVMGIGPVGSLVAKGVLEERERIILADFENQTHDSLLAGAVTEAFRVDFEQSPLVTTVPTSQVNRVLGQMRKDPGTRLDQPLAREVAIREGIKAVIGGGIHEAGTGYVLSARLLSAASDSVLAAYRETAADSTAIIPAIDRLSKRLRERIGESLKTIRQNPPLEQVTTGSLQALRKYSQALRAFREGNQLKSLARLEEAVALDTAFAMAYRNIAVILYNLQLPGKVEAATKAYEHRDRLTERERYFTLAFYYAMTGAVEKEIATYHALLDAYPAETLALASLSDTYLTLWDFPRAEEFARRAIEVDTLRGGTGEWIAYSNAVEAQVNRGRFEEAEVTLSRWEETFPGQPVRKIYSAQAASARGEYDAAEAHARSLPEKWRGNATGQLANLAMIRGKLAEADGLLRDNLARSQGARRVRIALKLATLDLWFQGDSSAALHTLDAALEANPLDSIDALHRPKLYLSLAAFYAAAGMPDSARAMLAAEGAAIALDQQRRGDYTVQHLREFVALTEERYAEAIEELQLSHGGYCSICALPLLGRAYDLAAEPDSALAIYERYVTTPWIGRALEGPDPTHGTDPWWLALVYERLGSLYEERGERDKAIYYYGKLVDLWKDADPELQPRVEAARRAIEALSPAR